MEYKKYSTADDGEMGMEVEGGGGGEDAVAMKVEVMEPEVASQKEEVLYQVEEEKLQSILPDKTWMKILNKLDFEDQENCANAIPYVRKLLRKEGVVYLFPKVIEIMAPILEQEHCVKVITGAEKDAYRISEQFEEGDFEAKRARAMKAEEWKESVLKCRLVCPMWNNTIENYYQRREMTGIPEFVNELNPRAKLNNVLVDRWTRTSFEDTRTRPELVQQFLEYFEESHHSGKSVTLKNPFIGRYVSISATMMSLAQLQKNVTRLMEVFGKEIWYLKLNSVPDNTLKTWLALVPNLKYLQISGCPDYWRQNVIERDSLPKLEKLEVLSLDNVEAQIGSEFIQKNCHVTHLNIFNMNKLDEDVENSLEMSNLQGFSTVDSRSGHKLLETRGPAWKKLKKLHYGRIYKYQHQPRIEVGWRQAEWMEILRGNEESMEGISALQRLVRLRSHMISPPTDPQQLEGVSAFERLSRLRRNWTPTHFTQTNLRFERPRPQPPVEIGAPTAFSLFEMNWASTLIDLRLEHPFGFDETTILEQSQTLRLNLPKIQRLTLFIFDWGIFLDFALPMKDSLEHLEIQFQYKAGNASCEEYKRRVERNQAIELIGFEERMHQSNIWQVFGRLSTVKIGYSYNPVSKFTIFTKEGGTLIYF